jgi:type III pantothenate kinase
MGMILAVDISNTTIKLGLFQGDDLAFAWQVATERHKAVDDYAMLLLSLFNTSGVDINQIIGTAISCVVPPLRSVFTQLVDKYLKQEAFVVTPAVRTGIVLTHDYPPEVGGDRIVNALATLKLYGGPAIAVAFGTATVFDCITETGEYLGGAIAPGIVGAFDSLTRNASQLFKVELVRPPRAIGKNSIHTMQSGVVFGFAGLVEGLVSRLKGEMVAAGASETVKVIATGGLADVIAPETSAIDIVDHQLTLKGLKLIYNLNR